MYTTEHSYDKLSKKPLLFKSFTGLTVKEFNDVYIKEILKRYDKHEIRRLSKRKDGVEKDFPDLKSSTLNRKKRNQKELAQEEKECNRITPKKGSW